MDLVEAGPNCFVYCLWLCVKRSVNFSVINSRQTQNCVINVSNIKTNNSFKFQFTYGLLSKDRNFFTSLIHSFTLDYDNLFVKDKNKKNGANHVH